MLEQVLSVAVFLPLVAYVAFLSWTYFLTESCAQKYLKDRERYEKESVRDWTITVINQRNVEGLVTLPKRRAGLQTELIPVEVEI